MTPQNALAAGVLALCGFGLVAWGLWATATATGERPPQVSEEERLSVIQERLDRTWARLEGDAAGAQQPTVSIVRYSTPGDQFQNYSSCLNAAGFPSVYVVFEGIVSAPVPQADRDEFAIARYTCEAQYPVDPAEIGYFSKEQVRYLAQYRSAYLSPCLQGAGVLPSHGSSVRVNPLRDPYVLVRTAAGDAVARAVFNRCPPYPREFRATQYVGE